MNDILIKQVDINTPEYQDVWQLREDILRRPLGQSLRNDDLSMDAEDIILAAIYAGKVIGCLMLHTVDKRIMKLRQMAVYDEWQGKDIGRRLVQHAEVLCADLSYTKIVLHARQVAIGFYSKLGYTIASDVFTEVNIPHVVMEKELSPVLAGN